MVSADRIKRIRREKRQAAIYQYQMYCRYFAQIADSLKEAGTRVAVWSAEPSKTFEQLMMSCSFHVRRYRVSAYKGSKSQSRFEWVASEDKNMLPRGGGKPRLPLKNDL